MDISDAISLERLEKRSVELSYILAKGAHRVELGPRWDEACVGDDDVELASGDIGSEFNGFLCVIVSISSTMYY